ncbi:sensor histidine kinase [Planomonospora venezuelensis]|uniref:Oxygen sensor histidine kinase NreB n=1 Tax=Planomonospora venezuelensis TaxID=1999 RepID=A0A841DHE5_PLAVE|nr:sensor histidine kinase [Planomonospora venezuelensis]MBB5967804.1 signal transduction histidine kinase [Planomonospora venezuelensis]GIN03226.1 histidine kinase [Planomonospora venezuelensis]
MSGRTSPPGITAQEKPPFLLVTAVPYTLLAGLAVFTVADGRSAGGSLLTTLGLCGAAAAWMLGMFTLRPAWWGRPRIMEVFFAGLLVITAALVVRDPVFGLLTPAPYIYAFTVLRWPRRLAAVAAVAVVAGVAQSSSVDGATSSGLMLSLVIIVANVVLMGGTAWVLRCAEQEQEQREQALEELSRTNRLLEATLAENAGLHAQLLAQAREAGVLDERQRMAREIHDTLAQGLTGIIAQLQAAEQMHEVPTPWARPFDAVKKLARESLAEARRSVDALRPGSLDGAHLSDALADVADRWSRLHGPAVQVTTTGTVRPMTPEAEFALLRTAQEALANVAKHAGATRVGVTLSYLEHEVALDVRDDGRGFAPAALGTGTPADGGPEPPSRGGGFGLTIMRQRVEGLSGTLRIESEPGAGTGISACIPLLPAGSGT